MKTMKNIVLIGMPSSGKSTLGVVLAKTLRMQFVDTDLIIQQKTGKRLQELINENGTDFFLKTEQEIVCSLDLEGFVIATGGSVVLSDKAMQSLKDNSVIIYLEASLEELDLRLNNIKTRGIAMEKGESLESVYIKRKPLYERYADIIVSSENSFEATVEIIVREIKNSGVFS